MDPFALLDRYLADFRRHLLRETVLEILAIGSISAFSVFVTAVALAAVLPGETAVGAVTLLVLAFLGLALAGYGAFPVRRRLADPVHLSGLLSSRVPALGSGLRTVIGLRPELSLPPAKLTFSPALLHAEALRCIQVLSEYAPEDLIRYRRALRLLLFQALLIAAMVGLTFAFPSGVARGVRDLLGLSDRYTPTWLAGPVDQVDILVSDIRTTLLLPRPGGGTDRVPGDETGEIAAPRETPVEVSGRLTVSMRSASLVLSMGGAEERFSVFLAPDGGFSATVRLNRSGRWHIEGVSATGTRIAETASRPATLVEIREPSISLQRPERTVLRPGVSVPIRYTVSSPTGLSGIDCVHAYPLAPDRPPTRIHLADYPAGTRHATGEVVFTMPADIQESNGCVAVEIEAFGRIATGSRTPGRSGPVNFFLDTPKLYRSAAAEATETLLTRVLAVLADLLESPQPPDRPPDSSEARRISDMVALGKQIVREFPPEDGVSERVPREVAGWLDSLDPSETRGAILSGLEKACLALDERVTRSRAARVASRIGELGRESARLRAGRAMAKPPLDEIIHTLERARRLTKLLDSEMRTVGRLFVAEGGMSRLIPARFSEVSLRAQDFLVSSAERLRKGGADAAGLETLSQAALAIDEVVRVGKEVCSTEGSEPRERGVQIPSDLNLTLRQALDLQRDVLDRTAQASFTRKTRVESLAGEHSQDIARLIDLVGDARSLLDRVAQDRLVSAEAEEVARLREDIAAIRDLLEGRDLDMALKMTRDAIGRITQLAADLRDEADWLGDDKAQDSEALRKQAGRLGRAATPLREVGRTLSAWKKEQDVPFSSAERDEARGLKSDQDRALRLANRLVDTLRRIAEGADEAQGAAGAARRNMEEASRRLTEVNLSAAEAHQRQAVQDLLRLNRLIQSGLDEGGRKGEGMVGPPDVRIEAQAVRPSPDELRRAVSEAMKEPPLPAYEATVKAYYDALVKPR